MGCCHSYGSSDVLDVKYKYVLWVVLLLNGAMFVVEIVAGIQAGSVSLWADSLDFMSDTINYAVSLFVLNKSLKIRAKASLVKGLAMVLLGVMTLLNAGFLWWQGGVPEYRAMGLVGVLALAVNVGCALLLYRHRRGDSNRQSVWLCSRNDAIGNVVVVLASFTVAWLDSALPDLLVGVVLAMLSLSAGKQIIGQAWGELRG